MMITKLSAASSSSRAATWFLRAVLFTCHAVAVVSSSPDELGTTSRCEEITIPMCRGIGYNYTFMPNQFNHDSQDEAGLEVHQFWPLVEIQCSPDLKFFLCSMYTPICIEDYSLPLPACRSVCERAKGGCAPLMRQYGFAWPERMNCDRLPEYGDNSQLCMDSKNGTDVPQPAAPAPPAKGGVSPSPDRTRFRPKGRRPGKGGASTGTSGTAKEPYVPRGPFPPEDGGGGLNPILVSACPCECKEPLVWVEESSVAFNRVWTGGVRNCALPCGGAYFSSDEKTFASFWIGLWAVLCCASTAFTVATFLVDPQRFRYPERPIIFLSACYLMVAIGFLVRLGLGPERVSCDGPIIRYEAHGPSPAPACTAVFILTYFFGMASSVWWVVLSLTWFLAAGLKWGNEAIAGYSHYFHLAAWLAPTIQSVSVLAWAGVDGDPVAGVCSVGNQDVGHLRTFVLAPNILYLLVGTGFLAGGFVALFRIRSAIKAQAGAAAKTDKLEKLMIRIGVFSVLYTVPAGVVVACLFYEQHFRPAWEAHAVCPCMAPSPPPPPPRPDYSVFMLKYFMSLVVGITSGFWIWSGKTLDSWRRFSGRLRRRPRRPPPPPLPPPIATHTFAQGGLHKQMPLSHV